MNMEEQIKRALEAREKAWEIKIIWKNSFNTSNNISHTSRSNVLVCK